MQPFAALPLGFGDIVSDSGGIFATSNSLLNFENDPGFCKNRLVLSFSFRFSFCSQCVVVKQCNFSSVSNSSSLI